MEKIIIGIVSAVVGFLSGLLTPWIKWQIEKRRDKQRHRRDLIRSWRDAIDRHDGFGGAKSTFGDTDAYASLRPHMREEAVKKFEASRTAYVGGGRGELVKKQMLLDEVARIESKWGLV
jgi:hypothetical protein